MPAYRTPVRYKGSRCGLCSYCGCSRVRQFCAYPACYIYSRWRRPRAPLWPPLRAFNIGAVSFCSPLFRFVFLYSVSPFVSSCVSFCVPFCVSPCVSPCVPSLRLVSYRSASRFASRLCVSSCVLFMRLAVASRHCVPFSLLAVGCDMTFIRGAVSSCLPLAVSPCVSSVRVVFVSPCVSTCVPILYAVHASHPAYCSCVPCRAVRFRLCVPTCVSSCIPLVGLPVGDGI